MRLAKAPATQAGYDRAGDAFYAWLGYCPLVNSLTLTVALDYVVCLFDGGWSYAEANKFRCWLAREEIYAMGRNLLTADRRLLEALAGYRKAWLDRRIITAPVQLPHVLQLLASPALRATAKHMLALAYACLLRYSEAVDVLTGVSSLERVNKGWLLHLTRSKCDVLRRGTRVLFKCKAIPESLHSYLDDIATLPPTAWDLPSRSAWHRWLAPLVPGSRFHSFRHGRVLDLIADGYGKDAIMHLGRWRSLQGFGAYDGHA
jgi:hypothetical protein